MTALLPKYVGIDFSGSQGRWNPNVKASNVWIAEMQEHGTTQVLISLQRVQELPDLGRPFPTLANWLAKGGFSAAAIDAPFSIPWWFFGQGFDDHADLMAIVNNLPLTNARDFPTGTAFVDCVKAGISFDFSKPLRLTESYWRGRRVEVRSTVWAGKAGKGRPGAPFASACLKLLANVQRPLWPWARADSVPLVEAFPAAQLRQWKLPCTQYNGAAGKPNRAKIVADLTRNRGLQLTSAFKSTIKANADALDAVLSCYAARAVTENQLGVTLPPFDAWRLEGWIAVHN
jgi:hypothetical protein